MAIMTTRPQYTRITPINNNNIQAMNDHNQQLCNTPPRPWDQAAAIKAPARTLTLPVMATLPIMAPITESSTIPAVSQSQWVMSIPSIPTWTVYTGPLLILQNPIPPLPIPLKPPLISIITLDKWKDLPPALSNTPVSILSLKSEILRIPLINLSTQPKIQDDMSNLLPGTSDDYSLKRITIFLN